MSAPDLMAGVWTAIIVDQTGGVWTDLNGHTPEPYHRIMVVRGRCGVSDVCGIQNDRVLYEAQGWKDPAVEWAEARAVAAALNQVQQPAPDLRVVHTTCPDCGASLPISVTAEPGGRSDDGVLQVVVLADKTEVEAHSLTCNGLP